MIQTGFVGLEMKVFLFYFLPQFPCYKVPFYNHFLLLIYNRLIVCSFVVSCKSKRANTVKQGILYWTCTGLAIEVIGLAPYT